jgi:virulence-associated protein VagC
MTIVTIGMQDSLLVLEPSNTGWNSWESLIETNPQGELSIL